MKLIDVNAYAEVADVSIRSKEDLGSINSLGPGVIFCHDASVATNVVFPHIRNLETQFSIISVRDIPISEQMARGMPPNVTAWFANNVCCSHEKVFGIPIGLAPENIQHHPQDGHDGVEKRKIIENLMDNMVEPNKVAYMSHSNNTNPRRHRLYELFNNKDWVTMQGGGDRINFKDYIANIQDHRFTISPAGAGVDCHRAWECLYLGNTPVIEASKAMSFFYELPMIVVDQFENLTLDFLLEQESKVKNNGREMLDFDYWHNLIRSSIGRNYSF